MSQLRTVGREFGSITVYSSIDISSARIANIGEPVLPTDAATKNYVDLQLATGIAKTYYAGTGLSETAGTFSVNSSQTQITQLGNINTGTWSANIISVPYGGTGLGTIAPDRILVGNGSGPIASIPEVYYSNNIFTSDSKVSINDTSPAALSLAGGMYVAGSVSILQGVTTSTLFVSGQSVLPSINSTFGNFTTSSTNNAIVTSATVQNVNAQGISAIQLSASTVNATSGTLNLINSSQLVLSGDADVINGDVNISVGNLSIRQGDIQVINGSVNISNGNLNVSGTTTFINGGDLVSSGGNMYIQGGESGGNLYMQGGESGGNLYMQGGDITMTSRGNIFLQSGDLVVTSGNVSLLDGSMTSVDIHTTNSTITNCLVTSLTSNSLHLSNDSVFANITCESVYIDSLTVTGSIESQDTTTGNLFVNSRIDAQILEISQYISSGNVVSSGDATFANLLCNSMLTSTSIISTNQSITNLNTSSMTVPSFTANLATISSLQTNSLISETLEASDITTGSIMAQYATLANLTIPLFITEYHTSGNTLSTNISSQSINVVHSTIGNLTASISKFTTTTTGGLVVDGDISTGNLIANSANTSTLSVNSSSHGNIIGEFASFGNLLNGNCTIANLRVDSSIISDTVTCVNMTSQNLSSEHVTSGHMSATSMNISSSATVSSILSNNTSSTNSTFGNIKIQDYILFTGEAFVSTIHGSTVGSQITILPTNISDTNASGSVDFWSANYISGPTFVTDNPVVTDRATTVHITGSPQNSPNHTITHPSALSIGYVPNQNGGNMSGQITFERNDGESRSVIYTENLTNRLVTANASVSGGGGIGLYVTPSASINMSTIPSKTDVTETVFAKFQRNSTVLYSTEGNALSVPNGGIYSQCISTGIETVIVTEGSLVTIHENSSTVILKPSGPLMDAVINLPSSISSTNGKIICVSTIYDIANVTFGNAYTHTGTLLQNAPKRYANVVADSTWYNI